MSFLPPNEVYVIAEMANSHEGRLDTALAICEAAAKAGAHAIKVQVFTADEVATPSNPNYALYKRLEMSAEKWAEFIALARKRSLMVFCDVEGFASADMMNALNVDGFKVHASDTKNRPLLKKMAGYGKPVFLSTGGLTWMEIAESIEYLKNNGAAEVILMHGIQNYPTRLSDSSLRRLHFLRERFGLPLGYAPHVDGATPWAIELPLLAAAAGAQALEIHLTLDRSAKGLDYYSALEPEEFAQVTRRLKEVALTLGSGDLALAPNELEYRLKHKKHVVAARDIAAGETLTDDNLDLKRVESAPAAALSDMTAALGKKAARAIAKDSPILPKDMQMTVAAVLACRLKSTRLYGKPMQLLGEEPILAHLIRQIRQVKALDHIVLAICEGPDSAVFIDYAQKNDCSYVLGPEKDVLKRLIIGADKVNADIILRDTTENPYCYWQNVDEMIRLHIENGADLTVTEKLPCGSLIEVISTAALKKSHQYGNESHRSECCSLYIFEHPEVFKIQRIEPPAKLQRPEIRLTVDTPEDLMVVRNIWENLPKQNGMIPLEAIVDYLDQHPEIVALNAKYTNPLLWK